MQRSDEEITWLSPKLVAEIKFAEWTDENQLRQASFKGLRTDKPQKEINRENSQEKDLEKPSVNAEKVVVNKAGRKSATVNGIRITSPDKEMFEGSGITKEDLAKYYHEVSVRMMEFVGNRILSLVRCPDGASSACFYQKHLNESD